MTTTAKLISLLRPAGPEEGWEDWAAGQAPRVAGLQRMVFNEVLPMDVRHGTDLPPPFSGVLESWFDAPADAHAFADAVRREGAVVQLHVDELLIHDSGRRPLPTKIMVTLTGRADKTRAQAQHHWRTRHVEVGLIEHNATDFLRLYLQNHVRETDQPAGSVHDYDGMPEYWLDPADLASVGADSPVMRAINEDEKLFADQSTIITLAVVERELFVATGAAAGWPVRLTSPADLLP